jgi:hypothetical protein
MTNSNFKTKGWATRFRPMANFSIRVFTMALAIVLLAVSCGKDGKDDDGGKDGSTKIKDVTKSNWQAVVKDYFGIDLSAPNGWTVNEAESLNGQSDVRIEFTAGGTTDWAAFGVTVFDKTKAVSTDGIKGATNDNVYTSFDDAKSGSGLAGWKYFYGSKNARVTVIYSIEYDGSIALSIDGLTK